MNYRHYSQLESDAYNQGYQDGLKAQQQLVTRVTVVDWTKERLGRVYEKWDISAPLYPRVTASKTELEVSYSFKFTQDETYEP